MQGVVWLLVLVISSMSIQVTAQQDESESIYATEPDAAESETEAAGEEAQTEEIIEQAAAQEAAPELEAEPEISATPEEVEPAPEQQPEPTLEAPAPAPSMQPQTQQQPLVPAPIAKPAPVQPPVKTSTMGGEFDTTDITEPSGNWLYKRYWWSLAEQRYDKIQDAMNKIVEAQAPFFSKREEAEEKIFDPLIFNMGLSLGELSVILSDLNEQVKALKEKQGTELTPEQKDFLDTIALQQKTLEQLQEDVQGISKIDNFLEEDLQKLSEQIKRARDFEKDAWENFRAIAKELSDAKARELYYAIEAFEKSISDIQLYIEKPLTHHFDQLIKIAKDQSERITHAIQGLKEKGIDFKQRAETMEKEAAGKQEVEKKEEEAQLQEESSWTGKVSQVWDSIMSSLASVWGGIADSVSGAYSWVTSFFVSESAEKTVEEPQQQSEVKIEKAQAVVPQPQVQAELVVEKEQQPELETAPAPAGMPTEPIVPAQPPVTAATIEGVQPQEQQPVEQREGAMTSAQPSSVEKKEEAQAGAQASVETNNEETAS